MKNVAMHSLPRISSRRYLRCASVGKALAGVCFWTVLLGAAPASGQVYSAGEFALLKPEVPAKNADGSTPPPVYEQMRFDARRPDEYGMARIVHNVQVPTLTIYFPADPALRNGKAMVICPGGGYSGLVLDREGHSMARYFANLGFTTGVLKYRLPEGEPVGQEELPVSQQDALAAIRALRSRAAEFGFAADQVGIMGFSAGGHLAGSTAVFGSREDGSLPDFVALIYPVTGMGEPAHAGSRRNLLGESPTQASVERFTLHRNVHKDMPPFFLAHADDDTVVTVDHSTLLAEALQEQGVEVLFARYEKGRHGFARGNNEANRQWPQTFVQWVNDGR